MVDTSTDENGALASLENIVREQSSNSTLSLGDTHIWRDAGGSNV